MKTTDNTSVYISEKSDRTTSTTEGRIALFTSELVESGLIMLQNNRAGHGQGQGYKF